MARKRAFTLVELLIVVGIIALLVTLIMPSLGRARDLAKKTVCGGQLKTYGNQMLLCVEDKGSYPMMGTVMVSGKGGWPKLYGMMEHMRIPAPARVWSRSDYSSWELDEVWPKAFCPAMDEVTLIRSVDRWYAAGHTPAGKASRHRAAVGYKWNVALRGKGVPLRFCPSGRWPSTPSRLHGGWWNWSNWPSWDNTFQTQFPLHIAGSGDYVCQAIKPDEVDHPGYVAEAWDSWDVKSIPEITWGDSAFDGNYYALEKLSPGWHVGPQSYDGYGWALLNGGRHPGSPNILYADGHSAADAHREVAPDEAGSLPGGATFKGAKLRSWTDFQAEVGTMGHIFPERSIDRNPGF